MRNSHTITSSNARSVVPIEFHAFVAPQRVKDFSTSIPFSLGGTLVSRETYAWKDGYLWDAFMLCIQMLVGKYVLFN